MQVAFYKITALRFKDTNRRRKRTLKHPAWFTVVSEEIGQPKIFLFANHYIGKNVVSIERNSKIIAKMFFTQKTDAGKIITFKIQIKAVQYFIDCEG